MTTARDIPRVGDPTDREQLVRTLARTYGGPELDRDGWERVEEYQRVVEYAADHPDQGSQAVSTALDLPRERIRPWVDGDAKPDPVRGIDAANDQGWLDLAWGKPPLTGLVVLVAWVFAGGSVDAERWVPSFAVDDDTESLVRTASGRAGVAGKIVRSDADGRAAEFRPTEAASLLGRVLAVLGAPVGAKARQTTLTLPAWLDDAPKQTRFRFAQTYVRLRGTPRPDRPNRPIALREERSAAYRDALRGFLGSLVGDHHITGDSPTLYLTQSAAAVLDRPPLD